VKEIKNIATNPRFQLSIKSHSVKKNRHNVSPLEKKNYVREKSPLFYAIIYGSVVAGLLLMLLNKGK
jgi:hypothetical protein